MRIGIGYDVHRLVEGRKLILGGVEIPFEKGLLGYSDADVLVHAISDALLGAAGLGDIGRHFPDTDPQNRDIDSLVILRQVKELLMDKNYEIINIDSIIIAQEPKLADNINQMKTNITKVLNIKNEEINIKATTTEGLGFAGTGQGIASQAVCLIIKGFKGSRSQGVE